MQISLVVALRGLTRELERDRESQRERKKNHKFSRIVISRKTSKEVQRDEFAVY